MTFVFSDSLNRPLDQIALVFFDIESTGLHASEDRICEIALRRVRGATLEASYNTLVNPCHPMDSQAYRVHQISPEMLKHAPLFVEVAPTVLPLLHNAVLVAHNAPFDVAFLNTELRRLQQPPVANHVIDTLVLSRRILRRSSHSLASLAADIGLSRPSHRAMDDVMALEGLYRYLLDQLAEREINSLDDLLRFQRGLLPGQVEEAPPPVIEQALRQGRRISIVYRSVSTPEPTLRLIRPIEITHERSGLFLRAFCYLRNDLRSFALEKIESMELIEE
jgi:DNA polymerase-3 subunit epsilon